ncbi:hypothetical protein [Emticicia sp. 21SJ11W-3]|nr:hypothetical protein [Emticicia sp. 21SJ11W-3]UTA68752.1 hypothetical protein MB380_02860 [Emticicia sp. 21SJ11W-3]
MEAAKQKSDELEVQEQPKKAWVKPEMKNLDVDSGSPAGRETSGYRNLS